MNNRNLDTVVTSLLGIALLVYFAAECVLNLTPPVSRDALVHHLAIPKLWLKHGGFYETPWANYSYYPMYINLLYLVCLYFKNDVVPKYIHLAFGMGTAVLIYAYLKERLDRNWGLLGAVIFFTTPIVVWLSTAAYVDLGMTFFVSASILAFIRWRDSEYRQFKWLFVSSFCMGIAVGSKYNALIALMIMNLLLMHSYARDTSHQAGAVKYGSIFFAITALVASPWYVKNYILTQNPFYPLFESFFKSLHHQPIQKILHEQVKESPGTIGFFQMREVLYGETFWETLLIPIRMFFQGKDDSYQYFQGVLNPILILFSPFILLDNRFKKDKLLFAVFSILFIIIAYFTTLKQVRYMLPAIPFLTILAVFGIKHLSEKLKDDAFPSSHVAQARFLFAFRFFLFGGVSLLLSLNFFYLKDRFGIIRPLPYVFRQETRDAFLRRHLPDYPAVQYINANLQGDANVFLMFLGRRGYYLEKPYKSEPSFGMNTLSGLVKRSYSETEFQTFLESLGSTHLLVRMDLFHKYLKDNFSEKEIARFVNLVKTNWKLLYESNGYAVWEIRTDNVHKP